MAGGQESGLRTNEAEISRVIRDRRNYEALKAALNRWSLDPTKALSVTPAHVTRCAHSFRKSISVDRNS